MDKTEATAKNGNVSSEDLQEYTNLIKQRTQFYKEENTKMEEIFRKLKLCNVDSLDKLIAEVERNSVSDQMSLNQAEMVRKQNNYLHKMKLCIRHYKSLNSTISSKIQALKCESEQANPSLVLNLFTTQDIQELEEKARRYESELNKFGKSYPWLKNPEYDLPEMAKHMDHLKTLKKERDSLANELSVYKDLKPDIAEAKEQLEELKNKMKADLVSFKM